MNQVNSRKRVCGVLKGQTLRGEGRRRIKEVKSSKVEQMESEEATGDLLDVEQKYQYVYHYSNVSQL